MSTLNVSNITDGTDTVETGYVVNGSAKAWVSFDGSGTPSIKDSLNTSSITDISTGKYSQNFTNSFNAADFAFSSDATAGGPLPWTGDANQNTRMTNLTASLLQVLFAYNTGSIAYDPTYVSYTETGELA